MPRNVRSWASAPPALPPPTMRTWGASRDARAADRVIDASIAPRASRDVLLLGLLFLSFRERAFSVLVLLGLLALGEVAVLTAARVLLLFFLPLSERAFLLLVLLVRLLSLGEIAVLPVFHGVLLRRGSGRKVATPVRRSLHPVERPRHGLLPERVFLVALGRVHPGLPFLVLAPVGPEVLDLFPEPDRQPRRVGRTERGGFRNGRTDDRDVQHIGLELHQRFVVDHAAVDLERRERDARVGVHGLDDLLRLPGGRFEDGACDMALVHVPGEPCDHAARGAPPARREEPG